MLVHLSGVVVLLDLVLQVVQQKHFRFVQFFHHFLIVLSRIATSSLGGAPSMHR